MKHIYDYCSNILLHYFSSFSLYMRTDFQYQAMQPSSLRSFHQGQKWIYLDYLTRIKSMFNALKFLFFFFYLTYGKVFRQFSLG